jgi:UDP-4-amino-4,6-dideoxy-N-acetyl-beta-L-altrosamine transaminase
MRTAAGDLAPQPARAGNKPRANLPYGRQLIEPDDVEAVVEALKGDFLTTGPIVTRFENALSSLVGAREAVSCSSGTSALYMAARALGLKKGDSVIVPAITFVATASAPHLAGAEIVFSDVDPDTGLMRACDLEAALARTSGRAAAVFPVHFGGQSCDMAAIAEVARARGMKIVEDAAHALGTAWQGPRKAIIPVGACQASDLAIFSFHPVKTVAMGEGGAVTGNDPDLTRRVKLARNHGITREPKDFTRTDAALGANGTANPWYYELAEPGFNFRISDINCALGLSQLKKLPRFVAKRQQLVACYDALLSPLRGVVRPLLKDPRSLTSWHIYVVKIDFAAAKIERSELMRALSSEGIGTQVHYIPVHRQPYYAARYGAQTLPGAESYYASTLTLPLYAAMEETDVERVVGALKRYLRF